MKVHRPELLLCALFGGVLAGFANAYWSLDPTRVLQARLVLGLLALIGLVKAVTARPAASSTGSVDRRWGAWLAVRVVGVALAVAVTAILVWMHAAGYITALIVSSSPALSGLAAEIFGLLCCAWLLWRRPSARPLVTALVATLLFAGSFLFVILNVWMWTPPGPAACEAALRPGVSRLSPAAWAQQPSHPFRLLYVPEESWLVASFKMGGNGHLSWWDDPTGNRMMGVDVRDPSTIGVLPLTGEKLPCYMTYHAGRREVLVSRMGPGEHSVDVIGLAAFPKLTVDRTVPLDYAPHEVVSHPSSGAFGVVGQHGQFVLMGDQGFEAVDSLPLDRPGDHVAMPLFAWQAPGTSKVYASFLMYPVAEIDMVARTIRWSEITKFGGGQLVGCPETNELLVTDMIFDRVDVLDLSTLKMTRRLALDYTPRAVQVDASRDLLMVGEWFGGVVRFYRLSTLEPLDVAVPVGSYVRDLAYDSGRGLLFTASQCGVYQLHVDALVAEATP